MIPFLAISILLVGAAFGQSAVPTSASSTEISALQKSAEAGDAQAEFALAQAYDFGKGIAQNEVAACTWYRKAAEQGFAPAQNALGLMYREGRGVEQSKEQAVEWYRKAAKQQYAKSMFNLGTAYYNGDGVAIDDIAAYAWFLLAQQYGSEPANDAVSRTAASLQPWQVSAAFDRLGDMYQQEKDLPRDDQAALDWYRRAARLGDPSSNVKFANFLILIGGEKNYQEALHSCETAARQLYSQGALCVGYIYQHGLGTPQNLSEASVWFKRSVQQGNAQAMLALGEMYWDGQGVKQDRVSAYTMMLLASTADLPKALQDKLLYEQSLTQKQIQKAQQQASEWAKTHHTFGLMQHRPDPE